MPCVCREVLDLVYLSLGNAQVAVACSYGLGPRSVTPASYWRKTANKIRPTASLAGYRTIHSGPRPAGRNMRNQNTAILPNTRFHRCIRHPPTPTKDPTLSYWEASNAFSAAILASIFFRAARIISSRLFFNSACLSSLLALHPSFAFSSASASSSLEWRLYRVMRSGCLGRSGCFCVGVLAVVLDVGGGRGWKVTGGYYASVNILAPLSVAPPRDRAVYVSPAYSWPKTAPGAVAGANSPSLTSPRASSRS